MQRCRRRGSGDYSRRETPGLGWGCCLKTRTGGHLLHSTKTIAGAGDHTAYILQAHRFDFPGRPQISRRRFDTSDAVTCSPSLAAALPLGCQSVGGVEGLG